MEMFDNIEAKLKEIRSNDYYKSYINEFKYLYDRDRKNPLLPLDYKTFMTFAETGSRAESEAPYFHKRRRLGYLTMLALIYPEEKTFIDDICEVVWSICSEISWVIAAHLHCNLTAHKSIIDLFAAETGLYLSELVYLLKDRLPENICDLIKTEVSLRIFDTMENTVSWWESLNSNWAAVCGGSVGMAYMYLAPERFTVVKERIMASMHNYLDGIGDDGCCSEGISYWNYGFSFYIHFAEMLYRFTGGEEDIRYIEKVKKLVEFQQNMIMRNHTTVSFSDGSSKSEFVHIGLYSYLKRHYRNFKVPPIDCYNDLSGNKSNERQHFTTGAKPSWIIRDLLWSDSGLKSDIDTCTGYKYYDVTQWYLQKKEKYSFAAKAGHNGEEHNHNDVGAFIIATDKGQIICDLGAMEYTKAYCDPVEKYNVFNISSLGHSVPIINGEGQFSGRAFSAANVSATDSSFSMDIEDAYKTDIKKITRSFNVMENEVIVTDEYVCDDFTKYKITERFISVIEPKIVPGGVQIGDVLIKTASCAVIGKVTENDHNAKPADIYTLDFEVKEKIFKAIFEIQKG